MGQFATHRFRHGKHHVSLRVEDSGHVLLLETALNGEVVRNAETRIDPVRARELVTTVAMMAPRLRNEGGDLTIGFGATGRPPRIWNIPAHAAPTEAFEFAQRMQRMAGEIVRDGHRSVDDGFAARDESGDGIGAGTFLAWTAAFFGANLVTGIASVIVGLVLVAVAGVPALLAVIPIALVLQMFAFYYLGKRFGGTHGDSAAAWGPAATAILLPTAVLFLVYGEVSSAGLMGILLPLAAGWGQDSVTEEVDDADDVRSGASPVLASAAPASTSAPSGGPARAFRPDLDDTIEMAAWTG